MAGSWDGGQPAEEAVLDTKADASLSDAVGLGTSALDAPAHALLGSEYQPPFTSLSLDRDSDPMNDERLFEMFIDTDAMSKEEGAEGNRPLTRSTSQGSLGRRTRSARIKAEQQPSCSGDGDSDYGGAGGSGDSGPCDQRKSKRVMANRQSAQRSRVKKLGQLTDLEKSVEQIKMELDQLAPQVEFFRNHHQGLSAKSHELRSQVNALKKEVQYNEALNNSLQGEVTRLKLNNRHSGITADMHVAMPAADGIPTTYAPALQPLQATDKGDGSVCYLPSSGVQVIGVRTFFNQTTGNFENYHVLMQQPNGTPTTN